MCPVFKRKENKLLKEEKNVKEIQYTWPFISAVVDFD